MELGIAGKRALICASSKGLGLGCARALAEAGANIVMNARGEEALALAAEGIRSTCEVEVTAVAADITTEEGRAQVLQAAGMSISWSPTPAGRRRASGPTGTGRISSPRWTPTC
ncbi:NAD(P)-dependent dehydrogenase (short-subunit alcohol dehydrogenase family) [Confluentimicrobium naphthalenivorans]|uniref:NAD(P)-dependent dehydrogenase (Short-subunit alcohol dehydrogenase family) n=1 Tax=Actibacterium naphthalenivorans TaxID=1614693 RepID=A0A840C9Y9_9RHOB|nr:NAD(P)-dependent dehydrogenase (short-subunit alcohol dehydrogenase family) [Actibacterium naphthalenivorans]